MYGNDFLSGLSEALGCLITFAFIGLVSVGIAILYSIYWMWNHVNLTVQ